MKANRHNIYYWKGKIGSFLFRIFNSSFLPQEAEKRAIEEMGSATG